MVWPNIDTIFTTSAIVIIIIRALFFRMVRARIIVGFHLGPEILNGYGIKVGSILGLGCPVNCMHVNLA